ncbi:MAG: 4-hydroxythreonine-4-phosphate dehydrogenase PdxA [Rhizobiaceae bacterium]|nr:4-hydroxythreonine-4-phosphate dehydrogenase PdxA [Rhizobiaceae bacterium]
MTNKPTSRPPLAVTMGDPCGIGPDIILRTWLKKGQAELPHFFVIGSANALKSRADSLGISLEFALVQTPTASVDGVLNIMDTETSAIGLAGKPSKDDALSTIEAIETAVRLTCSNQASGIVTAPINKKALYSAGFNHPGHTEFLAELAERHTGSTVMPVMMLAGPELKTVPVTIHIALEAVPGAVTQELIEDTARITAHDLRTHFGIESPKLAIAGLNPHAGEEGAMGMQDIEIIAPAVATLQKEGIDAIGPLPADTMFHAAARKRYDVALCMYHDQALVPAKTLGFDDAVNVTLGLPFVRTSPDHGTAYDIAGTGKADISSFVAALKMAVEMTARPGVLNDG